MVRNGGRNGIALTAGFRWTLPDKKAKKDNKNVIKDDKNIKEVKSGTVNEVSQIQTKLNKGNLTTNSVEPKENNVKNLTSSNMNVSSGEPKNNISQPDKHDGKTVIKSLKHNNSRTSVLTRYNSIIGE